MSTEPPLDSAVLASATTAGAGAGAGASLPLGDTPARGAAVARSSADESMVDKVLRCGRLWQVIGVFFGVGVLLSLTPCVLPMLPILSSLIVGTERAPSRLRGLLLAGDYFLGMSLVYTGLGVVAGLAGEGFAAALQTTLGHRRVCAAAGVVFAAHV